MEKIHRMNISNYNNIGIYSMALCSVLQHMKKITVSEALLIAPLITHQELLNHLARKTTTITTIENLIVSKTSYFSNFNRRYYDSLTTSINSILFLHDIGYINIHGKEITLTEPLTYSNEMGSRVKKIFSASCNISRIFSSPIESLYLNLRVEL